MKVIATPTRDLVQGTFTYDLVQLIKMSPEAVFSPAFGTSIPNLRRRLASTALANGATHILFIDSDMRFPPDALKQLLRRDKDVIGANCVQRTRQEFTARADGEFISSVGKSGIDEVDTIGFGVTLIKAGVFRALPLPWFATPYDEAEGKDVGEDVYFCGLAREHGFGIWVDHELSRQVRHTGNKELAMEEQPTF